MPKNRLYKYRCKELLCNQLIRSDKWNDHWKKKHRMKFNQGVELKKEIIEVREHENAKWERYKAKADTDKPAHNQDKAVVMNE
jgi:hypothetical protein